MSLHQLANHMSARGRGPDSTLVHMSPREVEGLQKLAVANGTSLTINPDTGLPEAFSLQDLLPTLIGGAATYFTGGAITPLMAALGTGAVTALTSKDLGKGLMAGLGAYGGAGIVSGLAGFGTGALSAEAGAAATQAAGAATAPLESEILSQAAIAPKLAGASYADKFGAGLSKAMNDPMGAASAIGGGSKIAGLAKVAGALSPLLAGETGNTVQTVTKRPSTAMIRPYRYDNMSQTFEEGTPYAAANGGLMGLAHGGAVRRFNGNTGSVVNPFDPNANWMASTGPDARMLAYINERFGTNNTAANNTTTNTAATNNTATNTAATNTANTGGGFAATAEEAAQVFPQSGAGIAALSNAGATTAGTTTTNQGNNGAQLSALAANADMNAGATTGATGIEALSQAPVKVAEKAPIGLNNALANAMSAGTGMTVQDAAMKVLGRALDAEELSRWNASIGSDAVTAAELSRFSVAAQDERSRVDYAGTNTDKIRDMYIDRLKRYPDASGLAYFSKKFGTEVSDEERRIFDAMTIEEYEANAARDRKLPTVVTDLTTADTNYIEEGVGGSAGAGQIGGGTVINPNGTITTSPRIPGIPVGGFTGMQNVRDTYEAGGGDLGYTSPTYTIDEFNRKFTNTGSQKETYDYLMGKGDKPTKQKNKDGTFRELSRSYNEAVLGVPGSTNVKRFWDKTKGEYFRNPNYVHTAREPILDAAGNRKRDADGNYMYNTTTYKSINQAKAGLAENKLNKDSGAALFKWANTNNVDEQTVADALGITMEEVISIFAKAKDDETVKVKDGGLMQLANGGAIRYNGASGNSFVGTGGNVKPDFTAYDGEVFLWDWENGKYRPKEMTKDGKSYTWDKVSNRYKPKGAGAGIAGLLDMSGNGPPAGGENAPNTTPDWDTTNTIGNALSNFGLTTIGDYLQQSAKEGLADDRINTNTITGAYTQDAQNQRRAEAEAMGALSDRQAVDRQAASDARENVREGIATLGSGQIADAREARDLANAKAERDFDAALGKQTYSNLTTQYEQALRDAADRAALDAEAQEKGFLSRQDEADVAVIASDRAVRDAALRDEADRNINNDINRAPTVSGFDPSRYSSTSFDTNAKNSQAVAAAADRADRADRAAALSDFDARTDGGNYSGVIGGGVDAAGAPDGRYSGSYDFAHGGMAGYAQGGLGSLGGYSDGGRLLRGPGDGVSDSIPASIGNRQPARLADGEFVVPARIVSELGNGSTEAGARALYKMMARIQANRRKTTGKNSVAVDSKAHKYLPA